MNGEAVQSIAQLAREATFNTVEVDGVTYAGAHLKPVYRQLPERAALKLSTLSGLVDYLEADPDGLLKNPADQVIVHVASETQIVVRGLPRDDDHHSRETYAVASYGVRPFAFGSFLDRESFNIALQSQFAHVGDWAKVIELIGNVLDDQSVNTKDDGYSQSVAARKGVTLADKVAVPNPVTLAPFRSFPEILPVESKFILRVQGGGGRPVQVALFESDGGRWQIDTVARLFLHLETELEEPINSKKVVLIR